jgi:hypothetical protein
VSQIETVAEDDTLAEYLDGMFGPDAPPLPWDVANAYTRDALEVYYQARVLLRREGMPQLLACLLACGCLLAPCPLQTDLVKPYSGVALRRWLCEGTPAGVGVAAAEDAADGDGDDAAAAMRKVATAQRVRVDESAPLRDVLAARGHAIPSTLVLFVVARGTPGRERFLAGK